MRMKVVVKMEMSGIEVSEAVIRLPKDVVKDSGIQNLSVFPIVLYVTDCEVEEKEVKIKAVFMSSNGGLNYPEVVIQKDFLDSAFEQIRKVFKLSPELDLYHVLLKGAALEISAVKGELHLNKKNFTELITENS